jgi:hypothetical protein
VLAANKLIQNLGEAFLRQNAKLFASICDQYEDDILKYFHTWQNIPAVLRDDEYQRNVWAGTVIQIAKHFKAKGNSELINKLVGDKTSNPAIQLQNLYAEAHELHKQGKFNESNSMLREISTELQTLKGSLVQSLSAKVFGLLGSNYLKLTQIDKAKEYTEYAINECNLHGDATGVTVYEQNLALIQAYNVCQRDKHHPLIEIRSELVKAQKLSDKGDYNRSNALLINVLEKVTISNNPFIKKYECKVYGLEGLNYFRLKKISRAKKLTKLALQKAEHTKDRVGLVIYNSNLKTIENYTKNQLMQGLTKIFKTISKLKANVVSAFDFHANFF